MTLLDFLAEIPNGHNSYTVTYLLRCRISKIVHVKHVGCYRPY